MKEQPKDPAGESGLLSEAASLELHRADTWNRIRERIDRVAQAPDASAEGEIEGLLAQLRHIESSWVHRDSGHGSRSSRALAGPRLTVQLFTSQLMPRAGRLERCVGHGPANPLGRGDEVWA